jgi:acetylglutamate kinase
MKKTGRRIRIVVKLGGELLEEAGLRAQLAREIVRLAAEAPLVVVHGGGRAIDQALAARGLAARAVDGLRITDAATLEVVVAVLAGLTNTRLVAAIGAAGGRAVGLTGADAHLGLCEQAPPHRSASGALVDLGLVGRPMPGAPPTLLVDLAHNGYIPVVASIGVTPTGDLLNVNADTWAAHLAAALGARTLLIVGGTPGVLDARGRTLAVVPVEAIDRLVAAGHVHAGMVAKLEACREAWRAGVREIRIIDGRSPGGFALAPGTAVGGDRTTAARWGDRVVG